MGFTNAMMLRAVQMSKNLSKSATVIKDKENEIAELRKKLDLVRTGKCDETDPEKLKALMAESAALELELGKARLEKVGYKKDQAVALMNAAKTDTAFGKAVDNEAEKVTTRFTLKFN